MILYSVLGFSLNTVKCLQSLIKIFLFWGVVQIKDIFTNGYELIK